MKGATANSDSQESIFELTEAKNGARTRLREAAVVGADVCDSGTAVAAVEAATAGTAVTVVSGASIRSGAQRSARLEAALGLASLEGNIAALGSRIDLDDASAVEELTADTVGLSDPAVAAGSIVGIRSQGTENEGQLRVEADTVALGNNNAVEQGSLGDDEGLTGLGVDQRGGNTLALRVGQITGQAEAVALELGAAAVARQLLDLNSINVGEGSITTDETERVGNLRANMGRLNDVVERHIGFLKTKLEALYFN